MFKRQPISFNLECPHQKALYEYCKRHKNFSGFAKDVLFLYYKQSQNNNIGPVCEQLINNEEREKGDELNAIASMF